MEGRAQGVSFGIACVIRSVGLVEEDAAGSERGGQRGELVAEQTPDDDNKVEGMGGGGPGQGLVSGFVAGRESDCGGACALCGDGEGFVGEVGEGYIPSPLREPQGMTAGATGKVESAPREKAGAGVDQQGIRLGQLRFTGKEFGVPALAIGGEF